MSAAARRVGRQVLDELPKLAKLPRIVKSGRGLESLFLLCWRSHGRWHSLHRLRLHALQH